MSQVSKRPIKSELIERMSELLQKSFAKLDKKEAVSDFLEDILTPTERIMIAKRLAIALLLNRGWDQDAVSRYLKVSTSTVTNIKNKLRGSVKGFKQVLKNIETSDEWEQIWLDLQQGLEEIIAGRVGAYWKTSKPAVFQKYREKRAKYKIL